MTYRNTAEGAPLGTIAAASATAYPDAFSTFLGSGPAISVVSDAMHGTRAYKFEFDATSSMRAFYWSLSGDKFAARFYLKVSNDSWPTGGMAILQSWGGSNNSVRVTLVGNGRLRLANATPTTLADSTVLVPDTWYRYEVVAERGTSATTGRIAAALYVGDSETAEWSHDTGYTTNVGAATSSTFSDIRIGRPGNATWAVDLLLDDLAVDEGVTTFIGVPENALPNVDAGGNQTASSGADVTLTGTAIDPDGTIASMSWTQTDGPTVSLSGSGSTRTFTAPAYLHDTSLTFEFSATDSSGASATDTTVVTVLGTSAVEMTKRNDAEGATLGAITLTSETAHPDRFDAIVGAATVPLSVVDDSAHGQRAYRFSFDASSTGRTFYWVTDTDKIATRTYFKISNVPSPGDGAQLTALYNAVAVAPTAVYILGNGVVRVDTLDVQAFSSPGIITADTWYRLETVSEVGDSASTGRVAVALYEGDSGTSLWANDSGYTKNLGFPETFTNFRIGRPGNETWEVDLTLDDMAFAENADTFIGGYENSPPLVDAGPNQSVSATTEVTLTGTATDADGTIVSQDWSQLSGEPVTLSGTGNTRTFTAPSLTTGTTLEFEFSATDDDGATSSASVTVSVLGTGSTAFTKKNDAEGSTLGPVTAASATAHPNQFDAIVGNAAVPLSFVDDSAHGQRAYKFAYDTTSTGRAFYWLADSDKIATRLYFKLDYTEIPVSGMQFITMYVSGSLVVGINLVNNGTFRFYTSGTEVFTSSASIVSGTWYRMEFVTEVGTSASTGRLAAALYEGDSTSSLWTNDSGYTRNLGFDTGTKFTNIQIGRPGSIAFEADLYLDDLGFAEDTDTFIGAYENTPPVVDAGPNQTVAALSTVTLSATSTDADGTIVSQGWTQISGETVTLSGTGTSRTFTAPDVLVDTPLTFEFSATDDKGATSTDTVIVNVLGTSNVTLTKSNNAEIAPLGVIAAASATAYPDPFYTFIGPASIPISAVADSAHGSRAYKIAYDGTSVGRAFYWQTASDQLSTRFYFKFSNLTMPVSGMQFVTLYSGPSLILTVQLVNNGTFRFYTSGTEAFTTTAAIEANTWYRMEFITDVGDSATTGRLAAALYQGDATTSLWTNDTGHTRNLGFAAGATAGSLQIGRPANATWAVDLFMDDIAFAEDTTTFIGGYQNSPPIVNAGPDVNVDSYDNVVLDGIVMDYDGTVVSTSWTQVSGPTTPLSVTGTQCTLKAPGVLNDTDVVLEFSATDNSGATTTDPLTVSVRASDVRVHNGTEWIPAETLRWDGTQWV